MLVYFPMSPHFYAYSTTDRARVHVGLVVWLTDLLMDNGKLVFIRVKGQPLVGYKLSKSM